MISSSCDHETVKIFLALHKKTWILQHQYLTQVKIYLSLLLFHLLFPWEYIFTYSISLMWYRNYNFLGRSEKFQTENIS